MIFIALGSSIGNAPEIFASAETWLELSGVDVVKKSAILRNPPLGNVAKNEFSNAVWQINFPETTWEKWNWVLLPRSRRKRLKAYKLLRLLQACEVAHGRQTAKRWADRMLDLDLLMFDDLVLKRPQLTIPHPEIAKRVFVLQPWAELVDDTFEIPTLGLLKDLLNED